jgi:5-methylcytosine-specific restriction protein A
VAIPAVEKAIIEQALLKFDREFRATPEWADWEHNKTHEFAIHASDRLYPVNKVISLATELPVNEFTGSVPINGYLSARGFEIVDLRESPKLEFVKDDIYDRRTEIHRPFGGSFQSGIAPSDRTPAIFLFAGASGEQFGYHDRVNDQGVYSYTGEGQIGHMELTRGNLAIQQHAETGRALHLFKSLGKGKGQQYVGEFCCSELSWEEGLDKTGAIRKIIKFHLIPVNELSKHEAEPVEVISKELAGLSLSDLRRLALEAAHVSQSKGSATAIRTIYYRSQKVKAYVLSRAKGKCESCEKPAPFTTRSGLPYLEPHHINRLSDGGLDHPKFMAAICPDCHREIHFGSNGEAKNEALRETVKAKELNGH